MKRPRTKRIPTIDRSDCEVSETYSFAPNLMAYLPKDKMKPCKGEWPDAVVLRVDGIDYLLPRCTRYTAQPSKYRLDTKLPAGRELSVWLTILPG
jgi:hypothetical protein